MKILERETDVKANKRITSKPLPVLFSVYLANCKLCQDILCANKIPAGCYELHQSNQENAIEGLDKYVLLFYGKPVFFSKGRQMATMVTAETCLPCCFVLNTEKIMPKHIYPFDPTACPLSWQISDFNLGTSLLAIDEHIKKYFENNFNYVKGICKKDPDSIRSLKEKEMQSLFANIEKSNEKKTVEIFCDEIELSTVIEAIIIPESVSKYDDYMNYIHQIKQHTKLKVLKYDDHYPCMPADFNEVLFQILMNYHKRKRRLS